MIVKKRNMSNEKDNWMEDVFQSMKGSQKAKPDTAVFAKIEARIDGSKSTVIPLRQRGYAVAASLLILVLNALALYDFTQGQGLPEEEMVNVEAAAPSLISNFQIYE